MSSRWAVTVTLDEKCIHAFSVVANSREGAILKIRHKTRFAVRANELTFHATLVGSINLKESL